MKQSKKIKLPIRAWLSFGFLLFTVILLIILWLVQTVFLEDIYKVIKTSQVKNCAEAIADNIGSEDIDTVMYDIQEQNDMAVSLYDVSSNIFIRLSSNDPSSTGIRSFLNMSDVYTYYQKAEENNGSCLITEEEGYAGKIKPDQKNQNSIQEGGQYVKDQTNTDNFNPDMNPDHQMTEGEGQNAPQNENSNNQFSNQTPQQNTEPLPPNGEQNQNQHNSVPADNNNSNGSVENNKSQNNKTNENNSAENSNNSGSGNMSPNSGLYILSINSKLILLSDTLESSNGQSIKSDPPLERKSSESIAYALVKESGESKYLVIVESEITPVTSVVQTIRFELLIVTAVLVLISLAIAVFTASGIAKPIIKTNETAKELAKQNYDIQFDDTSYKEINELNHTLSIAATELGNVDALRRELIANVSHDLRTPLTMITGYAQVMQDIPGENTPENLQVIIDESNRLSMLVSDLLDISKLEAGAITLEKNLFSLTDCIRNIFHRYTKLKEQENINIEFIKDEEVFIIADELKLTQVIYNLINNAINYIGEDKTVIVKQSVENGKVRVDIIDHGDGIPEDKLQYIWDRYYKVDKEHRRAVIGTGLGLSIVKNILVNHDAEYGVTSTYGEGSDFYFILPVADIPDDSEVEEIIEELPE